MKFENIRVMNFENAIRGMRNPKNSWDLSDSKFGLNGMVCVSSRADIEQMEVAQKWAAVFCEQENQKADFINPVFRQQEKISQQWLEQNGIIHTYETDDGNTFLYEYAYIGPKDMKLAQSLIQAGSEHRKFMRQIFVSVDITAPLYIWKEIDTYKVGTVANSTSTMHKLTSFPITRECFEMDDFHSIEFDGGEVDNIINYCEKLRQEYIKTKDKKVWKELIRWLPESFLQKRTMTMNYENLLGICSKGQRRFHKLNEWSGIDDNTLENFIKFARSLPYAQELIFIDELI